jgi:ferredoxin
LKLLVVLRVIFSFIYLVFRKINDVRIEFAFLWDINFMKGEEAMPDLIRYFITKRCTKCTSCLDVCPEGAIYEGEDKYEINDELCKGCGCCTEVCPEEAIVHETDPLRSMNREADSFFGGGAWPIPGNKRR